jgi:hypothetical protein
MRSSLDHKYEEHPLYGRVRLVRRGAVGRDGKERHWWEYDSSFRPPVPPGAIPGDPSKQVFCSVHLVPKYFFVDERRVCVDCDEEFLFGAAEQRYWYETLKFNFGSVAIRCPRCRKRQRRQSTLNAQVAAARAALEADPDSPTAHLDLAESLVLLHRQSGQGRLSDAVAAARRVRELWPQNAEADLWEGLAHAQAGRLARARTLLQAFMSRASSVQLRRGDLFEEAERALKDIE